MNSRRLTDRPKAQDRARLCRDYSKEMRSTEWGSMVSLQRNSADPTMSPLGHLRRFCPCVTMSALPSIATE
jgi:hypothetical protein